MSYYDTCVDEELKLARQALKSIIPRGTDLEHAAIKHVIMAIEYLHKALVDEVEDLYIGGDGYDDE